MNDPVEEIKSRLDITDVVGQYVQLKKSGANFKGLCPFHQEKSPSFMVSTEKQIAYCFGCQKGGDIFGFTMEVESVGFKEALEVLAMKAGVTLPERKENAIKRDEKSRVFEANKLAAQFYENILWNDQLGDPGRKYLEKRVLEKPLASVFGVGCSPDSWDGLYKHLKEKGFNEKELVDGGLAVKREKGDGCYDKFRGRLMFPIKNSAGLVVGFGARAFSDDVMPKYLNTSETVVYHKSSLLYNFDQAKSEIKRSDMIVVVEGYMDVIASWKTSIRNVVASSGTALTEDHLRLIKRLTNKVSFAFDSDGAGIDASMRAIDMALSADMEVYAIVIPGGKDADECIKTDPSAWEKACEDPLPYLDFIILQVMKKNDIGTAEGRSKVAKDVLTHIKKLSSVIQQDFYIQKLAGELGVSASVLRDEMQILKSDKKFIPKNNSKDIKKPSVLNQEDYIYGILLNYPDLFVILNEVISSDYDVFSREIKNEILELKLKWEKGDLTDAINSSRTGPLALKVSELYVDFTEADYAKEIKRLLGGMKKKDSKNMISYKIDAMKKAEIAGDKDLVLRLKGELQELLKKK